MQPVAEPQKVRTRPCSPDKLHPLAHARRVAGDRHCQGRVAGMVEESGLAHHRQHVIHGQPADAQLCRVTGGPPDRQLRGWLATGELDPVFTYDIGEEFSGAVTSVCRFPAHALLRCDDPLARQDSVTMQDLAERPLSLLDLPETRTYLLTLFDFAARRPKVALRTWSYETVRTAVVNGLCVSVLNMRPNQLARPDHERLVRVPISDPPRQPKLIVIDPYGDQKPTYVQSLIAMLFAHLQDLGPENFAVTTPAISANLMILEQTGRSP